MLAAAFGFVLGFMGYLPPGTINLTVVQLVLNESRKRVWTFILLATLMEFLYCLGSLTGLNLLLHLPHLIILLKWTSVFVFALLGLLSFFHNADGTKTPTISGFSRGVFAVVVNPFQVPFWLMWGVYLTDNKWLHGDILSTVFFALVTSMGTTCVLWVYAIGGKKVIEKMKLERKLIDRSVGVVLIGLAFFQLFKLLYK